MTPPEILQLTHGNDDWVGTDGSISATWQSRDLQSHIKSTEYCVGTSSNGCQVKPMTKLAANSTQVTCPDCQLSHSVKYYLTVRAWNQAGLYTIATTEGQQTDLTPPISGQVVPTDDVIACVEHCTLSANVGGFVDQESGISICRFAIRNSSQLMTSFINFSYPSSMESINVSGLTLVPGQRYYTIVSCQNHAGLGTTVSSAVGVLVDNTPPSKGVVIVSPDRTHDVYGVHSSCHLYNSTMRIHWSRFNDAESAVTGFRVAVGRKPNQTDVLSFRDVGIATSVRLDVGQDESVFSGDIVYVVVEARNAAGLVTKSVSAPTRLVSADNHEYLQEGDFFCLDV